MKNNINHFRPFAAALVTLLMLAPIVVRAQFTYNGTNYTTLKNALQAMGTAPGNYTILMTADGNNTDAWPEGQLRDGQNLTIKSNVNGVRRKLIDKTQDIIEIVGKNASLSLKDIVLTGNEYGGSGIYCYTSSHHITLNNCEFLNLRMLIWGNSQDNDPSLNITGDVVARWDNPSTNYWVVPIYAEQDITINGNVYCSGFNSVDTSPGSSLPSGVISAKAGNVTITGNATFTNIKCIFDGPYINTPILCGGAIYSGGNVTIGGNAIFNDCSLESPTVSYNESCCGGAIYAAGDVTISGTGGATFTDCVVKMPSGRANGRGGAIYCKGSVSIPHGATFTRCQADSPDGHAGGLYIGGTGAKTVTGDMTFIDCYSAGKGGGAAFLAGWTNEGGNYFTPGSSVTYNGNIVCQGCTANNGSGGGIFSMTDLTINGTVSCTNCESTQYHGGGVASLERSITIADNTNITDCTAQQHGGGIYASGSVTLNGSSNTLTGNTATTGNGGGIFCTGGTILNATIGGSNQNKNRAGQDGGGIYNNGGTLTVSDVNCSSNEAGQDGGGVYNNGGTLTVSDVNCSSNEAAQNGGGVYTKGNPISTITNTTTTTNTTTETVQRVEYIEVSTIGIGGDIPTFVPYINTGITFSGAHKTWAKLQRGTTEVFGFYAYTGTGASQRAGYKPLSSNIQHAWPDKGNTSSGNNYSAGTDMTGIFEVEQDYQHIKLTDCNGVETVFNYSGNSSAAMSATWTLLRPYVNTSNSTGRLYEAKIWDGSNNLIGHYIPCYVVSTGQIGVYDAVNETFLGNAGRGSFTKGADVAGETYTVEITTTTTTTTTTTVPDFNVTLNNCTIGANGAANTAVDGAGVYINKGGVTMNEGSCSYNAASNNGGGFYNNGGGLKAIGATLNGNTATGKGGAIYTRKVD